MAKKLDPRRSGRGQTDCDLDLAGFRAGYRWVAGCYLVAAVYLALAYPSGTAADRQRAAIS